MFTVQTNCPFHFKILNPGSAVNLCHSQRYVLDKFASSIIYSCEVHEFMCLLIGVFHLIFYLVILRRFLSGNMTTSSFEGLKWFFHYIPKFGQNQEVYKFVQF